MRYKKAVLLSAILFFPVIVWADEWPPAAKQAYIERCAESMSSQGLEPKTAKSYCSCVANGMEKEFGRKEYDRMMKAQPNPKGDQYDRRLYKVLSGCSKLLPR